MKLSIKSQKTELRELDDAWATSIKARDNWECVICGSQDRPNAHHIIPREIKEYRYEMDNGITLCITHHKFGRQISAHNAPLAFFLWLQTYQRPLFSVAIERIKTLLLNTEGISL